MEEAPFDRALLRRRRDRAAAAFAGHAFLLDEVAERLVERLGEVKRAFPRALDLGCRDGRLAKRLGKAGGKTGGIETLVQAELSPALAARAAANGHATLVADEEFLPFGAASFDLVLSLLALHAVNDLPGALMQIRHALKPDGLFLAAIYGGSTLIELREALIEAELEASAGVSPRVAPFVELSAAGGLLQRAGFALPMVDLDRIAVSYGDALALMRDLRGMGESNALAQRLKRPTGRATLFAAAERYAARHAGADGRIPASFEILFLTAWAPGEGQPKALRPGSAAARLADALGSEEIKSGVKTGRA